MLEVYGVEPPVRAGDLEAIAAPMDHLGLNYYFRQVVTDEPDGPIPYARMVAMPEDRQTAMGWEVHPDGLEELLLRVTNEYQAARIYVTENGSAWPDEVLPDGQIEDKERTIYLEDHLAAGLRATRGGAPFAGYFAWSLLDNFEWAYGYAKRFGLVHVDYPTQRRTIKASGHRYAEIIRRHKSGDGYAVLSRS
jgi:beta-glucosidase